MSVCLFLTLTPCEEDNGVLEFVRSKGLWALLLEALMKLGQVQQGASIDPSSSSWRRHNPFPIQTLLSSELKIQLRSSPLDFYVSFDTILMSLLMSLLILLSWHFWCKFWCHFLSDFWCSFFQTGIRFLVLVNKVTINVPIWQTNYLDVNCQDY